MNTMYIFFLHELKQEFSNRFVSNIDEIQQNEPLFTFFFLFCVSGDRLIASLWSIPALVTSDHVVYLTTRDFVLIRDAIKIE